MRDIEEFKYFVVYEVNKVRFNHEIISTYIEGIDDIKRIEEELKEIHGSDCMIINYRMF